MTKAPLASCVRTVLERHHDRALVAEILGALERSPQRATAEELLVAARPRPDALVAPVDGSIKLVPDSHGVRVVIESPDGGAPYTVGVVQPARLRVAAGDRVQFGAALTDGTISLQSILSVHGISPLLAHLGARFAELLAVPRDRAEALAAPMLALQQAVAVHGDPTPVLVSRAWAERVSAQAPGAALLTPVVTGYDVLATHVDPPVELFLANEAARLAREREAEAARAAQAVESAAVQARAADKEHATAARHARRDERFDRALLEVHARDGQAAAVKLCIADGDTAAEGLRYVRAVLARTS